MAGLGKNPWVYNGNTPTIIHWWVIIWLYIYIYDLNHYIKVTIHFWLVCLFQPSCDPFELNLWKNQFPCIGSSSIFPSPWPSWGAKTVFQTPIRWHELVTVPQRHSRSCKGVWTSSWSCSFASPRRCGISNFGAGCQYKGRLQWELFNLHNFLDHWTVLQGAPKSSGELSLTV